MNEQRKREIVDRVIQMFSVVFWLLLGYLGALFSKRGFGEMVPGWDWVGWTMALLTIFLEMLFSKDYKLDPLLWWAGVFAYAWGIYTNILGWATVFQFGDGNSPTIGTWAMVVILSLVVEVLPERLLLFAIFGDFWIGDAVSTLLSGPAGRTRRRNNSRTKPGQNRNNTNVQGGRTDGRPTGRTGTPVRIEDIPTGQMSEEDKRKVARAMAVKMYRETGKLPSARELAAKAPLGKTACNQILQELRGGVE